MLKLCYTIDDLDFRQLMDVYEETNQITGREKYPREIEGLQLLFAEQDFYQYLKLFFRFPGATYAIWTEGGRYKAALRLEEYRDGSLITALETHPAARQHGYATMLLNAVKDYTKASSGGALYSHVGKTNLPSMRTHRACGFHVLEECPVFLDGTVHDDHFTLKWCY